MRNIVIILFLILGLNSGSFSYGAVTTQAFLDDITNVFSKVEVDKYNNYFAKNIDIMIDNESAIYSKVQAQMVLKNYLTKVNPKEFKIQYRSYTEKNEYLYLISSLSSLKGKFYIYLTLKWENNTYKIIEIKIKPI